MRKIIYVHCDIFQASCLAGYVAFCTLQLA